MIISHEYRYIFLKTNKTAGTSVEIALSGFCGPEDVITPILPTDEAKRSEMGFRGPQNFDIPFTRYSAKDWAALLVKGKRRRFYNHIPASRVRNYVDRTVWDSYFKFCFERNPWDRLVSMYYWRCKREPRPTIGEFLASETALILKQNGHDVYTIDGQVAVDRICRFENLTEEMERIRNELGMPAQLAIPRTKSGFRKDKRSYRDILSEGERAQIADLFREEIDLLGYEY